MKITVQSLQEERQKLQTNLLDEYMKGDNKDIPEYNMIIGKMTILNRWIDYLKRARRKELKELKEKEK